MKQKFTIWPDSQGLPAKVVGESNLRAGRDQPEKQSCSGRAQSQKL